LHQGRAQQYEIQQIEQRARGRIRIPATDGPPDQRIAAGVDADRRDVPPGTIWSPDRARRPSVGAEGGGAAHLERCYLGDCRVLDHDLFPFTSMAIPR
jgi:hypothetical protein